MRLLKIFLDTMWLRIKSLRIEKKIVDSEEKYRNIIEKANDGIMIILNKTITFVNDKLCIISGYTKDDLIGKNFFSLYDLESSKKIMTYYTKRIEGISGVPNTYEAVLKTSKGDFLFVEQSVNTITIDEQFAELIFIRDISLRKKQEIELLKYSNAMENSPTSIIITDTAGRIEYVNRKFTELTGYLSSEVIGLNPSILKSGETDISIYHELWDTIKAGNIWKGELLNKKKNGDLFWELVTISNIKDKTGEIQNFIAIKEDINFIKEKESELMHRNTNLRLLNECHISLLSTDDENEMYFAFSDIAVTILNYSLAMICEYQSVDKESFLKILSYSSSENITNIYSNQIIEITANRNLIDSINDKELFHCDSYDRENCPFNNLFDIKNNTIILVPLLKDRVNKNVLLLFKKQKTKLDDFKTHLIFELVNYIDFGLDIIKERNERRKLEEIHLLEKEQLNVTLNSITDSVITINKEGYVNYVNKATLGLLDVTESVLLGKRIFDLIDFYDLSENRIFFNPFDFAEVNEKKQDLKSRYVLINYTKHKKYVQLIAKKIYDKRSVFIGILIVLRDVTKIVKFETQSALSQKMESVGQLAAGIAHEINTPMQFVGDNTYFLRDAFDSVIDFIKTGEMLFQSGKNNLEEYSLTLKAKYIEDEIDYYKTEVPIAIDRTLNGIDRVRKIVAAMKIFAHSSSKTKSQSNINQGIEVTDTITKNEWKYIANVDTELDENLPPVYCSLDEINQVILNMIVNSAHAIAEKKLSNNEFEGLIKIKTYFDSLNCYIEISDNGCGIPQNKINKVFDPFFTTKEVGKGTGQGLSIAHNIIVKHHNGTIDVESKVNSGTVFTIRIPLNGQN